MKENKFINNVEKLIDPITVGSIHFLQSLNGKIPLKLQKKMVKYSSKKNSLMGFVVEPYCYFLCYEIKDIDFFEKQLPTGFELKKTKIFKDEIDEKYYCLFGSFNARTSAFFGTRMEVYIIAKDLKTGLESWVIVDYDTNTITYDEKNGLSGSTTTDSFMTTDYNGNVIVQMKRKDKSKELNFISNIRKAKFKKLSYSLWVEGNLSITYGSKYNERSEIFSLRFNSGEMKEALQIDLSDLKINKNSWFQNKIIDEPVNLVCFPFAQHYISDSPYFESKITNESELQNQIDNIDFEHINTYSIEDIKKNIFIVPKIMLFIIVVCILIIISK